MADENVSVSQITQTVTTTTEPLEVPYSYSNENPVALETEITSNIDLVGAATFVVLGIVILLVFGFVKANIGRIGLPKRGKY